jgi:hypothetical protein
MMFVLGAGDTEMRIPERNHRGWVKPTSGTGKQLTPAADAFRDAFHDAFIRNANKES